MRSHHSGADGVVRIAEMFRNAFLKRVPFRTTPSAPSKEASRLLIDVAATPPISGGEWRTQQHLQKRLAPILPPLPVTDHERGIYNTRKRAAYRNKLRKSLTPAEAVLWTSLQRSRLLSKKFRRQFSIGPYIVDFYCPECR